MQAHFPALKPYAHFLEADRVHTSLTGIAQSGIGGGIAHGIRRGGSLLNLSFHHQPLSPALSLSCLAPHPSEHLFDLLPTTVTLTESAHQLALHSEQVYQIVERDQGILMEDRCQHLRVIVLDSGVADVAQIA